MQAHQPLVRMNDATMNKGHAQAPCNPVTRSVHNTLSVTVLCWTVFIAVLAMCGGKQPIGHRLDTPDGRLLEKKSHEPNKYFFSIISSLKIFQLLKKKKSLGLVETRQYRFFSLIMLSIHINHGKKRQRQREL